MRCLKDDWLTDGIISFWEEYVSLPALNLGGGEDKRAACVKGQEY